MNILQAVDNPVSLQTFEAKVKADLESGGHTVTLTDLNSGVPDFTGYDLAVFAGYNGVTFLTTARGDAWIDCPVPVIFCNINGANGSTGMGLFSGTETSESQARIRTTDPLHPIAEAAGFSVGDVFFYGTAKTIYEVPSTAIPAGAATVMRGRFTDHAAVLELPAGASASYGTGGVTVSDWVLIGLSNFGASWNATGTSLLLATVDYLTTASGGGEEGGHPRPIAQNLYSKLTTMLTRFLS